MIECFEVLGDGSLVVVEVVTGVVDFLVVEALWTRHVLGIVVLPVFLFQVWVV